MKLFEIFYETVKPAIRCKSDVIVSVIHFMLVNECDYKCLGVGETFPDSDKAAEASELLPAGWNADSGQYALRYTDSASNRLILKCVFAGDLFIPTVLPLNSSSDVHSVSIKPEDFVTDSCNQSVKKTFTTGSVDTISDKFRRELFVKLKPEKRDPSPERSARVSVLQEDPTQPQASRGVARPDPHLGPNPFVYPRIGGADLDPFSRGQGGGMLFDPFRDPLGHRGPRPSPFLPRGSVPPGARFDPIGPPGVGGRFVRPDPDHLPPPGSDDMFM